MRRCILWRTAAIGPSRRLQAKLKIRSRSCRSAAGTEVVIEFISSPSTVAYLVGSGLLPWSPTPFLFGDGTAQQSMITKINTNFDSDEMHDPKAFLLEFYSVNGVGSFIVAAFTANQSTPVLTAGKSVIAMTFNGTGISGVSLPDGNYRIAALSSKVLSTIGSIPLDGDNNGTSGIDFTEGKSSTDLFFRLFGDSDGNGVMNPVDTNQFRQRVGKTRLF